MNNYPQSTKNSNKPTISNSFINVTDNASDNLFEGNINLQRNPSFVVNLYSKKTPVGTKIGTKMASYRTIEDPKVCDSKDQPDAPR